MGSSSGKRIVVTGATGNCGTSVVKALGEDPSIASVLGIARRIPAWSPEKTEWAAADLSLDPGLEGYFEGADAVIHLAWKFQPTHEPAVTWRTNVLGSVRVFQAAAAAGVPVLVHASSVGAYSPGPKDHTVDETWPTHGWPEAGYCVEKAYLERVLDAFEPQHPGIRVVRMRPGFMFKKESASEQRRIFAGRFIPGALLRPGLLPAVPGIAGLRFQALHTDDAAQAYRLVLEREVRGPFNVAAEPPVDAKVLARLLDARVLRVPRTMARSILSAAWGMHLVPASPQLFDAVLQLPLMDCTRAHDELGWSARHTAVEAIEEFLLGLREGSGMDTEPLAGHKVG
ncbi:SDR family oxidoreductase [Streptomyces sp. A3M-1-3]|uniref:SDR family oxidoreductase n=1 Tax=Streptomyces sp. A3M-1-3 TaxID=2962044 RepID=UPI0020B88AF4|nr:SDR family oxidoreductase [Streptomyces sp. A3M-1-3]MCP3820610.1 SDR family oxidoreductase [Streptomyces sp. A3M-1-3]